MTNVAWMVKMLLRICRALGMAKGNLQSDMVFLYVEGNIEMKRKKENTKQEHLEHMYNLNDHM